MFKKSSFFLLCSLIIAVSLWYHQPWSEYSPAKIVSMQNPDNLTTTMRNMKSIMPWRMVSKGKNVKYFNKALADLKIEYELDGQQKTLSQFIKESNTTGLLVIKNNTLLYENYYHGSDETSLFTSWSMAKSFVATAIAMAHREGEINSLNDTVETYAPQFSDTDYGRTRIIDLLAMSSGIDFNEDYADKTSDINVFFFKSLMLGSNPDISLLPFTRNRPALRNFHYISPNSHILASVLRAVYKKPLATIISEKIWRPLGMESDAIWLQHRKGDDGIALGYCCLNATLRDYARFGQFYIDSYKGVGDGVTTLPKDWAQQVSKAATPDHLPKAGRYQGRGYSYHFWLPPTQEEDVFFSAGIYGQYIWIDPKNNLLIVRTSADADWTDRTTESMELFKAITAHYAENADIRSE